jgi:hypothetical protein
MTKKQRRLGAVGLLAIVLTVSCVTPNWVVQAENIIQTSIPIVGGIAILVDPPLAPIVTLATNGLNTVLNLLKQLQANPQTGTFNEINAALATVNSQLTQIMQTAQIKDPATQQKVVAIIQLVTQELATIQQIVQANAPKTMMAKRGQMPPASGPVPKLDPKGFKAKYNAIVRNDVRFALAR